MNTKNKEFLLEEKLRSLHCRPMVKMFKFFNSDQMMAVATKENEEMKYIEMTRVQLNEYKEKLLGEYAFAKQLQFGNLDNDERKLVVKDFLQDININDMEALLNGEYLGLKIFKAYLHMIKCW